jgi:predicted  nucleic acid-binding Zn-ribbon protein
VINTIPDLGYSGVEMPHWNCERCGARLYSASKSLKRSNCPVCQGRLSPQGDVASDRFEKAKRAAMGLADAPAIDEQVDVTKDL